MTQPTEAVGADGNPADSNPADAFTEIAADMLGEEVQTEDDEEPESDELTEDDIPDEAEDDDLPPIDPPVSWDAEAKEAFKNLPRDLQETVQKRETERERFVQSKAQEASRAKQESEQAAIQQLAQIQQSYAQQYQQIAEQFQPQRPHPSLAQTDPATFYAMQAEYEQGIAQRQEAQQTAQYYAHQAQQAEAAAEQARFAQEYQVIAEQFPEYADPTTGPKLVQELSAVANELGYPPELISQARATDIIAMRKANEWKAKAEKYDRLQSSKMERVRGAKGLPRVATPGVAVSSDQNRATRAANAFDRAKTSKGADRDQAMAEYFTATGVFK